MQPIVNNDLTFTRTLAAPRELVFKVWTDPMHLAHWWGPEGFTNPVCEINLRPRGAIFIHMRAPDGTVYPMSGIYREIVEPERLVFIISALDAQGRALFKVLNTVSLVEREGNTIMTLQAQVIETTGAAAPYLEGQQQGWHQSLKRLDTYLKRARGAVI